MPNKTILGKLEFCYYINRIYIGIHIHKVVTHVVWIRSGIFPYRDSALLHVCMVKFTLFLRRSFFNQISFQDQKLTFIFSIRSINWIIVIPTINKNDKLIWSIKMITIYFTQIWKSASLSWLQKIYTALEKLQTFNFINHRFSYISITRKIKSVSDKERTCSL